MKPRVRPLRKRNAIGVLAFALLVGVSGSAFASHQFADVPTSAIYHDAVEWMVNRGVTLGCTTGLYCPDDSVTRAQMALFMQRLGTALTPSFVNVSDSPAALDIDAAPTVCQTVDYTPTFPARARGDAWVSLRAAGPMGARVQVRYSTDAGGSWINFGGLVGRFGAGTSTEWTQGVQMGLVDLAPGIPVRFAVQVLRESDAADATHSHCEILVTITNRNPTSSPLGVPAGGGQRRR